MTFLVSPSVAINEFDLTLTVPAVAATPAAFAGIFRWGPFNQRILLGSQANLYQRFFAPSNLNGETWFTAYSFLAYGSNLYTVRTGDTTGNTVQVQYSNTGNAMSSGNSVVLLNNTSGLAVGMKLFYSNSASLSTTQTGGVYIDSVNSTTITLSSAPTANAGNVELIFRSNIFYTAVGQYETTLDLQWADYNVLNANVFNLIANTFDPSILYVARYPGLVGNSLRVAVCDSPAQYNSNINLISNTTYINVTATYITANVGANTLVVTVTPANNANAAMVTEANTIAEAAWADISVGDQIQMGNSFVGFQILKVTNTGTVSVNASNVYSFTIQTQNPYTMWANTQLTSIQRYWEFYNLVGVAPGQSPWVLSNGNTAANDQIHVVVVDNNGTFSGSPGTILEVYKNLSRAIDAQNQNGTTNYYGTVINQQSSYVWWVNDRGGAASANAAFVASSTATAPLDVPFAFGDDGLGEANVSLGTIINGYNYFLSPQDVDISLIITGKALGSPVNSNTQLATWLINNIALLRKDCVVMCSPDIADVVNNVGNEASAIVTARNTMPSTSYAMMDSGYKYMYDQYNDVYRWVPLNGDIAGLAAQCDQTNAPWWSFAGFNRGNIKNVVQLAWNPQPQDRDTLYNAGVNPVVTFPGLGTVLFGDKTLFTPPSAFNRINVRRLFIVLEKSISTAAKFDLFEFNDSFTRSQFISMVTPFLQQVQSQRGIEQFLVRCDSTNNPPQVVQNNEFVADIFIQPNYSINWIKLNFVNVPPTISFAEAESIQY